MTPEEEGKERKKERRKEKKKEGKKKRKKEGKKKRKRERGGHFNNMFEVTKCLTFHGISS